MIKLASNHTFQDSKNWQNVQKQANGDYKWISNYHKGTGNNTLYLDLTLEEQKKFHLPK